MQHKRWNQMMKISNLRRRLIEAEKNPDTESAHHDADTVLCELLELLGHQEIVALYRRVSKWYA